MGVGHFLDWTSRTPFNSWINCDTSPSLRWHRQL